MLFSAISASSAVPTDDLDSGTDVVYLYDGWRAIEEKELDGANWEARRQFVFGGQYIDEVLIFDKDGDNDGNCTEGGAGSTRYLYAHNANYNVVALTGDGGGVLERYVYTPYGEVTCIRESDSHEQSYSHYDNPLLFQSKRYDNETGLYYYNHRYYHPILGRFPQRDPIGGINLYEFVAGASTVYVDPDGLRPITCKKGEEVVQNDVPITVNGCGGGSTALVVPDKFGSADFTAACNNHDSCYANCKKTKAHCDKELVTDMKVECMMKYSWMSIRPLPPSVAARQIACFKVADAYGAAVRKLGEGAHTKAQKLHCKCVPKKAAEKKTAGKSGECEPEPEPAPLKPKPKGKGECLADEVWDFAKSLDPREREIEVIPGLTTKMPRSQWWRRFTGQGPEVWR